MQTLFIFFELESDSQNKIYSVESIESRSGSQDKFEPKRKDDNEPSVRWPELSQERYTIIVKNIQVNEVLYKKFLPKDMNLLYKYGKFLTTEELLLLKKVFSLIEQTKKSHKI